MERNYSALRLLPLITGIIGIIGGLLWIAYGIFEDAFPKPLAIVVAVCNLINAIGIIISNRRYHKAEKSESEKEKE